MTNIPFSIYEAAILLNGYLDAIQNSIPRLQLAKCMSETLRQMATNSGMKIDDSFRSVSGIDKRLLSLECAYTGVIRDNVQASSLFTQIVDMYQNDRPQYDRILNEAKAMITIQDNRKEKFLDWVCTHTSDRNNVWLESNLERIETFCRRRNYIVETIYDITDDSILQKIRLEIERDKIFRLSCGKVYKSVLNDFFLYCLYCLESRKVCKDITEIENNSAADENMPLQDHLMFSLDSIPNLAFSKPVSFSYIDEMREPAKSWSNLYSTVLRKLEPDKLSSLKNYFGNADFSTDGTKMRRPIEICEGVFVELNFTATDLMKRLKVCFEYCNISLSSLVVKYRRSGITTPSAIPEVIFETIARDYAGGIRFDDTVLRLLSEQTGLEITEILVNQLREEMFERSDGLYFLSEMIAGQAVITAVKTDLIDKLNQYALCEVSPLYESFCMRETSNCLRGIDDYADFLQYLLPNTIRQATIYGTKIIRRIGVSKNEAATALMQQLVLAIKENNCLSEEELLTICPVLSTGLLRKILEKNTDEIVTTVINDILCYQTIEAMGFDESFSEMLNTVLEKSEELSLTPSQETLYVLLSVEIGQNFWEAYGIPDDKTFRRIIAMYYTGEKARAWKSGNFVEE